MDTNRRRTWSGRILRFRRLRYLALAAAAFPVMQSTGCFPDPIGAVNFELQSLVNTILITTVDIIVRNIFGIA